jgi:hypothetical protein
MLCVVTLILLALVLHLPLTTEPPTTGIHHGRTVRVPEDHSSIAEALASSLPNDRILIGPGTYYETLELPNHDVMLVSTDGARSHHDRWWQQQPECAATTVPSV